MVSTRGGHSSHSASKKRHDRNVCEETGAGIMSIKDALRALGIRPPVPENPRGSGAEYCPQAVEAVKSHRSRSGESVSMSSFEQMLRKAVKANEERKKQGMKKGQEAIAKINKKRHEAAEKQKASGSPRSHSRSRSRSHSRSRMSSAERKERRKAQRREADKKMTREQKDKANAQRRRSRSRSTSLSLEVRQKLVNDALDNKSKPPSEVATEALRRLIRANQYKKHAPKAYYAKKYSDPAKSCKTRSRKDHYAAPVKRQNLWDEWKKFLKTLTPNQVESARDAEPGLVKNKKLVKEGRLMKSTECGPRRSRSRSTSRPKKQKAAKKSKSKSRSRSRSGSRRSASPKRQVTRSQSRHAAEERRSRSRSASPAKERAASRSHSRSHRAAAERKKSRSRSRSGSGRSAYSNEKAALAFLRQFANPQAMKRQSKHRKGVKKSDPRLISEEGLRQMAKLLKVEGLSPELKKMTRNQLIDQIWLRRKAASAASK